MEDTDQEKDLILKKKRSREDNFICRGVCIVVLASLFTVTVLGVINYLGV